MNKHIEKVKMFEFSYFDAVKEGVKRPVKNGTLIIEGFKDVPFEIKRVFYIFGGNDGVVRGRHANRRSQFVLFNVSGTSKVRIIDENMKSREYVLDDPSKAVYLPEMVWKEMYDFSEDSVLMVLTNEYYDPDEYIRDFNEYQKMMREIEERGVI